jgi:hypothetical protein
VKGIGCVLRSETKQSSRAENIIVLVCISPISSLLIKNLQGLHDSLGFNSNFLPRARVGLLGVKEGSAEGWKAMGEKLEMGGMLVEFVRLLQSLPPSSNGFLSACVPHHLFFSISCPKSKMISS